MEYNYTYTYTTSMSIDQCKDTFDYACYTNELADVDWVQNVALPVMMRDNVKNVHLHRESLKSATDFTIDFTTVDDTKGRAGLEAKTHTHTQRDSKGNECFIIKDSKLKQMRDIARIKNYKPIYYVCNATAEHTLYLYRLDCLNFDKIECREKKQRARQVDPNSKIINVKTWYIPTNKYIKKYNYGNH